VIPVNHPREVVLTHRGVPVYCLYAGHQNPYIWQFTLNQDGREPFDVRDDYPGGHDALFLDQAQPLDLLVKWVDAKLDGKGA